MSDKFTTYEHHGKTVTVLTEDKGLHRQYCLCYHCTKFNPGLPEENCPIANQVYATCVLVGLVTPVWECPEFEEDPEPSKYL